jgi:hypothetical protein
MNTKVIFQRMIEILSRIRGRIFTLHIWPGRRMTDADGSRLDWRCDRYDQLTSATPHAESRSNSAPPLPAFRADSSSPEGTE